MLPVKVPEVGSRLCLKIDFQLRFHCLWLRGFCIFLPRGRLPFCLYSFCAGVSGFLTSAALLILHSRERHNTAGRSYIPASALIFQISFQGENHEKGDCSAESV